MKHNIFCLAGLCTSIVLFGCDPAKVLHVKTSGQPGVYVTMYANSTIVPRRSGSDGKTIVHVPVLNNVKKDSIFYFGIGSWPDEDVTSLAERIDSIIISNRTNKISLRTKEEIKQYLLKNRSGYGKSRITIEAK